MAGAVSRASLLEPDMEISRRRTWTTNQVIAGLGDQRICGSAAERRGGITNYFAHLNQPALATMMREPALVRPQAAAASKAMP